mmetsp:Transcript_6580/g.9135  ORF Transcript_6580/g.9135 Transcript_6580/m.9135 type:complete len:88 (-) Transcript_6580:322-585(-)
MSLDDNTKSRNVPSIKDIRVALFSDFRERICTSKYIIKLAKEYKTRESAQRLKWYRDVGVRTFGLMLSSGKEFDVLSESVIVASCLS